MWIVPGSAPSVTVCAGEYRQTLTNQQTTASTRTNFLVHTNHLGIYHLEGALENVLRYAGLCSWVRILWFCQNVYLKKLAALMILQRVVVGLRLSWPYG